MNALILEEIWIQERIRTIRIQDVYSQSWISSEVPANNLPRSDRGRFVGPTVMLQLGRFE